MAERKKKMTKTTAKATEQKKTRTTPAVVKKGDLVYVDYVGRIKEDGSIFDLTLEEVAKEEGVYKENARYEPMLVAVGHNWLLEAIEEELVGMKINESKKIEVPPERGAGHRDPNKIKQIPKTRLAKMGIKPVRGERVKIGNEEGVITLVTGRKVRVDFNSPLAGKTLVFDVTVRGIVTTPKEKILAIVKRRIPGLPENMFKVSKARKIVTVEMPDLTRYIEGVQYAEIGIASDVLKIMDDVKSVKLVVTFERREQTTQEKDQTAE